MNRNRAEQDAGAGAPAGPPPAPRPAPYLGGYPAYPSYPVHPAYPSPPMFPMGGFSFIAPAPAAAAPTLAPDPGATFRIDGELPSPPAPRTHGAPPQGHPQQQAQRHHAPQPRSGGHPRPGQQAKGAWQWGQPQQPPRK